MKKYEKTQAKLNKILLVVLIAAFTYNAIGIEFSDLSWETNKRIYINLMLFTAMILANLFEPKNWWLRK